MYLAILNDEQKNLFLNIAKKLASTDGNFSEDERQVIDGYCHEMSVSVVKKLDIAKEDMIERLGSISNTIEKKIIVFEFAGLVMADSNFDESERVFLKQIAEKFDIDLNYINKCEKVFQRYIELQNEINALVME